MKEQTETLAGDGEKLLSENEKLEKQQKKLQQELNKRVQSKEVMERNLTGEYKKIEPDCREEVWAQLERMEELCKE